MATCHKDRGRGPRRAPIWADSENPQTAEPQKVEAERLHREHPSQPFHFAAKEPRPREGQSHPGHSQRRTEYYGILCQLPSPRAPASHHLLSRGDSLPAVELGCRTLQVQKATARKHAVGQSTQLCIPWGKWVLTDTQG